MGVINKRLLIGITVTASLGPVCRDASEPMVDEDRCPFAQGEFPPSDCGIVEGMAVDSVGQAMPRIGIRADSFAGSYVFSSGAEYTGEDGRFRLIVYRRDAVPVQHLDSATIPIKAYWNTEPLPGHRADARAWVLTSLAPMGSPVVVTEGTFTFRAER